MSPRDTIRTFLTEYQKVVDEYLGEGRVTSSRGLAAYDRALRTLDFNNTPDGGSRWVQTEHLVFLQEILQKIAMPPEDTIPDYAEVKASGITEWTIPDTRITLRCADSGPYEGEWRFSARTVQMLPRYFRQMRDIPYRTGGAESLYDIIQQDTEGLINRERLVGNRLRAINLDSPRSALEGFLKNMNQAYAYLLQVDEAFSKDEPSMTTEEAEALERLAEDCMERAVSTLNLSEVSEALRYDSGIESAMLIKEIIDRMAPAPLDQIPDIEMVRQMRKDSGGKAIRWTYPNTKLEIAEIMDGHDEGLFKFSPHTIEIVRDDYERIKDLPYSERYYNHFSAKYDSADISPGFYEYYATTPGNLIPKATFWGRLVDRLPEFMHAAVKGQPLWQWIATIILYAFGFILSLLVYVWTTRMIGHCKPPYKSWLRLFSPLFISGIIFWVTRCITNGVNITGQAILSILAIERILETFLMSWSAFILCRALAETVIMLPQIKDESVDASLLRLTSRIIGTVLSIWVIIAGLDDLGIDIWPLIAGLGVGGLAVALAFRPTMENIIGSFMIFADKPFKVGQRVKVLGADGTVESIGLRSTKIRLLTGHLTSIPNEKMATVVIENIGQRPYIRRVFDVTITYDTKPASINRAVEIIREILAVPEGEKEPKEDGSTHPNANINQPDFPPRVYFNNLNTDSLNILVLYWYHPPAYWDFLEHANWVNVQIMERFAAEGIDFAFPTQTLHLAGDKSRPLTVGQRWESDEEGQSPINLFSQAAAFGAHSALGNVSFASASDEIKPEGKNPATPIVPSEETGDTSDAPVEEDLMDGDLDQNNR